MSFSQSSTSVIRWGILALLVFAPVAFGGDHIVPLTCIELATLAMLVLWAAVA